MQNYDSCYGWATSDEKIVLSRSCSCKPVRRFESEVRFEELVWDLELCVKNEKLGVVDVYFENERNPFWPKNRRNCV